MKISTRGRYAIRMLADIAENQDKGFVSLKDISDRQGISKKYLEQIVPSLSGAGILVAGRGFMGGYRLSREPGSITVAEVLRSTEGSLAPVACLDAGDNLCERASECDTLFVWRGLMEVMEDYLERVTIRDILSRKKRRQEDYVLL